MAYRMAPMLVTLNDLEGHSPVAVQPVEHVCSILPVSTDSALAQSISDSWVSCLLCFALLCFEHLTTKRVRYIRMNILPSSGALLDIHYH